MSDAQPLITLREACIESGGVTTHPITASGGQRSVALVGYFSPLFRLLRAEARLTAGEVRFAGLPFEAALKRGELSLASRQVPASRWTLGRYLVESARFSGAVRREAERRAGAVMAAFGLTAYEKRRLRDLPPALGRVASLARASLSRARVVCAEAPFSELDPYTQLLVGTAVERLLTEQALVLSFPALPVDGPARALLERVDFVVRLRPGDMIQAGTPEASLLSE